MNIFALDTNVDDCAMAYMDQHINKMILESAQMICSVAHLEGFKAPYRAAHKKHPCVLWLQESESNIIWLYMLAEALNREKLYRWGGVSHRSMLIIRKVVSEMLQPIDWVGLTPFKMVMPEEYQEDDPIESYREYYRFKSQAIEGTWTKRDKPMWL